MGRQPGPRGVYLSLNGRAQARLVLQGFNTQQPGLDPMMKEPCRCATSAQPTRRGKMNKEASKRDARRRPRRGPASSLADAWGRPPPTAPAPIAPPPAGRGSGRNRADRSSSSRGMAGVVHGARAGRGGPGRAQGRRRAPAAAMEEPAPVPVAAPQVNEPAAPPNFHWTLSWIDNDDHHDNHIDQGDKIYHFLRKSTFVDKMELVKFGVSEALVAAEPAGVEPMLNGVVDTLNMMMPIRQRYLYKYIHGERGDEMFKIEKSLRKTVERVDEKIQLIKDANGFCPPRPKLFDSFPRPKK